MATFTYYVSNPDRPELMITTSSKSTLEEMDSNWFKEFRPIIKAILFSSNSISNLRLLEGFDALNTLQIINCPIESISNLYLPQLKFLNIKDCKLKNLENLEFPILRQLLVTNCGLKNLDGIEKLTNLTTINCSKNPIEILPALAKNIEYLIFDQEMDASLNNLYKLKGKEGVTIDRFKNYRLRLHRAYSIIYKLKLKIRIRLIWNSFFYDQKRLDGSNRLSLVAFEQLI